MSDKMYLVVGSNSDNCAFRTLKEAFDYIKDDYDENGYQDSFNDYLKDEGIEVYEVLRKLEIREHVVRTILVNGEVASF